VKACEAQYWPMSTQNTINQLFNENSKAFGDAIEQQFEAGTYKRGDVFVKKVIANVKKKDAYILDYGCGTGRIDMMLGEKGYRVFGVDPAVEHISRATSLNHLPNVSFEVLTDATIALPHCFDVVISSSVFEFVPDVQQYIDDIKLLLKPGGILVISFPNKMSLWRWYAKIRFGKKYKHFQFQKNLFSKDEIRSLFQKNNFRPIGGVEYYESAFDHKGLSFLNASRLFGTLFVLVFEKE
jgi:2-polyprenyl-3-methyl-5-hydroxy-6-metoxy-1,4-benzoquinol methylase